MTHDSTEADASHADATAPVTSELLTIGEVADRVGVATSTLRYYEERGLIVSTRASSGQRRYTRDVLRRVAFVRAAQQVGLSLEEIRESLTRLPPTGAPSKQEWEMFAESWRPRLAEQIRILEGIRDRLGQCIGCGCQTLDACEVFNPGDRASLDGPGAHFLTGK